MTLPVSLQVGLRHRRPLQFGHCLVVLPLIIDQPLNPRLLVERKIAVEVERSEDGSFTRDGTANALRLAMLSEEGRELWDKARGCENIRDCDLRSCTESMPLSLWSTKVRKQKSLD